jgi:PhoPQ-activated pathogenicity-related protein
LGGLTFAFVDYTDANLTTELDLPEMTTLFSIADPINYIEQLATIPKYIVVSSSDEFMSMDWTNLYYDKLQGEKHLIIMPNAEHSMATGIYQSLSAMGTFVRSIAAGKSSRPTFTYDYNPETGELSVSIPKDQEQPLKVLLRHAETLSNQRRDFRWAVQKNDQSQPECKFPYVDLTFAG